MDGNRTPSELLAHPWRRHINGRDILYWKIVYQDYATWTWAIEGEFLPMIKKLIAATRGKTIDEVIRQHAVALYTQLRDRQGFYCTSLAQACVAGIAYGHYPKLCVDEVQPLLITVDPSFPIPVHEGEMNSWPGDKVALLRAFEAEPQRFVTIEPVPGA